MSRDAHIRWLYEELPRLVAKGLMPESSASALRAHYGEPEEAPTAASRALLIFGALGAVLVGLGIILLFAFNWDDFSRGTKTLVSFLPLVAGQALTAYAVFRRPESRTWRESSSAFLFLAVGATIALISQVYQMGGNAGSFLFVWLLLTALLPYAVKADLPALFYLGGVLLWSAFAENRSETHRLWYWALALVPLAHLWWRMRVDRNGISTLLLRWAYAIVVLVGLFFGFENLLGEVGPTVAAAYFAMIYLAEVLWRRDPAGASLLQRPFHVVGGGALAIFGLAATFADLWDDIDLLSEAELSSLDAIKLLLLVILLGLVTWRAWAARRIDLVTLATLPLTAIVAQLLLESGQTGKLAAWLLTLHLFAGSIWGIVRGLRLNSFGGVSTSLGLLSLLILLRFFDGADILSRAIAFIVVGIGFLIANFLLARRMQV